MSTWTIALAQPDDQGQCEQIDRIMGFETEASVHQRAIEDKRTLVARVEDRVIGYLRYGFLWDGELPVIQMIRIVPEVRRQGVGKALILHLEQALMQQGMHMILSSTDDTNRNSLLFHQSLGFQECGRLLINADETWEIFMKKILQ